MSDKQRYLANQVTEALSKLHHIIDIPLVSDEVKKLKDNAIRKILRAKELVKAIEESNLATLKSQKERIYLAELATQEALDYVEIMERFAFAVERVAMEEAEKIRQQVDEVLKRKPSGECDEWINILHLSDLHFGHYYYSFRGTPEQDKKEYFDIIQEPLFDFLKSYIQENGNIDVVVITGDISFRNDSKGYDDFEDWLKALCSSDVLKLDITKDVLLCVGNHDSGYEKRSEFGIYPNETADKDKNLRDKSVDTVLSIDNISKRQEQFRLFNNVCSKLGIERLKNFNMPSDKAPIHYLFGKRECKGINFVVLNTAWNSFPNKTKDGEENGYNHGNLYLGRRLVRSFLTDQKGQGITITLFHHPLSWLHETESRTYGNDQELPILKSVREHSDIILNGHVHGKIEPPDILANKTLVFSGGTLNTNDSFAFQFEILSINKTKHYCTQKIVTYNRQSDDGKVKGWETERDDSLTQFYFDTYRSARELLARISLGEITEERALEVTKSDAKEAFQELYEKTKFYAIQNILKLNSKQTQEEAQYKKEEEKSKTKSKEQDKQQ